MNSLQDEAIKTTLQGDWERSITLNKSLIEENPTDIQAYNRLAFALNILGKTKDAKETYEKVLNIDPLNQIALRNIKRIGTSNGTNGKLNLSTNIFLEEAGKTKIVELVNIAPSQVTNSLRPGEMVNLSIKRLKIFVLTQEKKFIGMLPDDITIRLIKFMTAGNVYEAYIKSSSGNQVVIFIREIKRANKFKEQPSFLMFSEAPSPLKVKKQEKDDDED